MRWSEVRVALGLALIAAFSGVVAEVAWRGMPTQEREYVQAGFGVFGALMTLFIAFFALVAAQRSAEASEAQVNAANRQADSADEQAEAARAQTALLAAQLKEQLRPILQPERRWTDLPWKAREQVYFVRNTGTGAASNVRYWFDTRLPDGTTQEEIGSDDGSPFCVPPGERLYLGVPDRLRQDDAAEIFSIEVAWTDSEGARYSGLYTFLDPKFDEIHVQFADRWTVARELEAEGL